MRRAITLTAVRVCVGGKLASEKSWNPKYPIFAANKTMRPNCGGSEKMRPLGYQRGDKANALRRLDYRLDQTMLQVIPRG